MESLCCKQNLYLLWGLSTHCVLVVVNPSLRYVWVLYGCLQNQNWPVFPQSWHSLLWVSEVNIIMQLFPQNKTDFWYTARQLKHIVVIAVKKKQLSFKYYLVNHFQSGHFVCTLVIGSCVGWCSAPSSGWSYSCGNLTPRMVYFWNAKLLTRCCIFLLFYPVFRRMPVAPVCSLKNVPRL